MRSDPPTGDELTRLLVSMKRNVLERVEDEPPPTTRSASINRIVGFGLGVTLLLGLGAGAAFALGIVPTPDNTDASTSASTPAPDRTPEPTPPSTEYDVDPWTPHSRHGLDCGTLIDGSLVSDLLMTTVVPADPLVTAAARDVTGIPRHASILAMGGTVCEWWNEAPPVDPVTGASSYAGVIVSVLPRPETGWTERAARYGLPGEGGHCLETGCWANLEVGDAWVSVEALGDEPGASNPEAWQNLLDAIIEAVNAAGPATAPGESELASMGSVQDCDAIIPVDAVRSITGRPETERVPLEGGGWSDWAEARYHFGDPRCHWGIGEEHVAGLEWLGGGHWAYERMLLAGTSSPVEIAGIGAEDAATIRCVEGAGSCAVDLRLGSDWFSVRSYDPDTAIALAEVMVANLES